MLTNDEWQFLAEPLYSSDSPMAMNVLDKLDNIVIEYGLEND
jgi:hypothetical protein